MGKTSHIKICVVLLTLLLGVAYVLFSYHQFRMRHQQQVNIQWQQTQGSVMKAMSELQKYLRLTEERIRHSLPKVDKLPSILSLRMDTFHKKSPALIAARFIPKDSPTNLYSRLGQKTLQPPFVHPSQDRVTYLGNGNFRWQKKLYDKDKQALGTLEVEFSLTPFLYERFPKQNIQILPHSQKAGDSIALSFTVPRFPYDFALKYQGPSFTSFLLNFKEHILLICLFLGVALLAGVTVSRSLANKQLRTSRLRVRNIKERLHEVEAKNTALIMREEFLSKLLKQNEVRYKETQRLFGILQDRYRHMASQAHAISSLTSKLIFEETNNDKLLKDIHEVSQESNVILARLIDGYPMKGLEETTDIIECLENVKTIFMLEIIKHNVTIQQKGKFKFSYAFDPGLLEIVFHNIFSLIMGRVSQNNRLRIEVKDGNPFQIIFVDDGYDLGGKFQKSQNPYNVLSLDKKNLESFVGSLGWKISFHKKRNLFNVITLSISLPLEEKLLSDNVINLFGTKLHGA